MCTAASKAVWVLLHVINQCVYNIYRRVLDVMRTDLKMTLNLTLTLSIGGGLHHDNLWLRSLYYSLTVVVANSFAGSGGTGAGRQALGARSGRTDGRRSGGRQRQGGQGRDRDAEDAADGVSSGRSRRRADERRGWRRRQAARRLRGLMLRLRVVMVVMMMLRRHRLFSFLGRPITNNPTHTIHTTRNA